MLARMLRIGNPISLVHLPTGRTDDEVARVQSKPEGLADRRHHSNIHKTPLEVALLARGAEKHYPRAVPPQLQ